MWFKILLIGLMVLTAVGRILLIGESRKPFTKGDAVNGVLFNGLLVWGIIYYL